jgi:Mn2+/Fe2+ NRAMP family transporter
VLVAGALVVLVPAVPLVPVLFFTQVLNAVLLLPLMVFLVTLGRTEDVMGEHRTGRGGLVAAVAAVAIIGVSVAALGVALLL